jgi:RNA polymerase sigma-70 factor (ECF subfamily)
MTGDASEADDLVQETLTRALQRKSSDRAPLERWLVTVAMNLARDRLRQRRRRGYPCPWLPTPVETEGEAAVPVDDVVPADKTPAARYELRESVSLAFLMALEALTPQQRAVLLLRDVFDYSVRETADCLGLSEVNVKTTHLRARRAMASYDRQPRAPMPARREQTERLLMELLRCLSQNDVEAASKLLADSVVSLNDGGGEFYAANVPVVGARKVMLFTRRISEKRGPPSEVAIRALNGLPALLIRYTDPEPRNAPLVAFMLDVSADGIVIGMHSILASKKLGAITIQ